MAPPAVKVRTGSPRDRHGRGWRGPIALTGPLTPDGPRTPTRSEEFDEIVLLLVDRLLKRWGGELGAVEFGTEDVPEIPADWGDDPVPFGSLVKPKDGAPARIVVFRRPVEMRAKTRLERMALVNEILIEHVADLLGREPEEIDP
jgi:hypothetical protein